MAALQAAVKLVVKTFLEQKHYQDLHDNLSEEWKHCHSLYAAVRLMEAHGVHISPKEEEEYAKLPEDRMIEILVGRMPQQNREQFEHFFLQLSLIASTTSRLRAALESGNDQAVEEVMDSAENVGILQFILKMAVAQAGQEVKSHNKDHCDWLAMCSDRMQPLLQSQATAMAQTKMLAQAKAQLADHHMDANEKSKKALMAFCSGNDAVLLHSSFNAWAEESRHAKREKEIREEYAEEIDLAEKRLQDYILAQSKIMKNMIHKKFMDSEENLKHFVFELFQNEVLEKANRLAKESEMDDLNNRMGAFSKEQNAKSKKALSRMCAGTDQAAMVMAFSAWTQFIQEYNKNREFEDAVKREEAKIAEFMKKQNEGAKSVLTRIAGATEHGLMQQCLAGWVEVFQDIKKSNELQEMLNARSDKFKEFGRRNGKNAGNAMERAATATEEGVYIVVFQYWKREAKVERMRRYARDKNVKKKNQLLGVKGLFKNFANELEAGLKEGTPRVAITDTSKQRKSGRQAEPSPKVGAPE
jgi:hypothetical protein